LTIREHAVNYLGEHMEQLFSDHSKHVYPKARLTSSTQIPTPNP